MYEVDTRKDGSEIVKYDYEDYYAYVRKGKLSDFANHTANCHWHDDLEFIYVFSGRMQYSVNGEIIDLNGGEGIMVNSRKLHFGFSLNKEECEYFCVLLHPMLLCATHGLDGEFVSPIISSEAIPYVFLSEKCAWQKDVLCEIRNIYENRKQKSAQLYIHRSFFNIWITITENLALNRSASTSYDGRLTSLKNMLAFVHKNYAERISLEDIARFGSVSKSTCLTLFKKYLNQTPNSFLINYRLKKAAQLLKSTALSVTEIASLTGFQGVSYFCESFKRTYFLSPTEYRNKNAS